MSSWPAASVRASGPRAGSRCPNSSSTYWERENRLSATLTNALQKSSPAENFLVVTNHKYKDLVLEHIPEIGERQVLANRSAAIRPRLALAAYTLMKQNPDAEMIVTPADHLISQRRGLPPDHRRVSSNSPTKHDALLTVGIKPTRPDTGYGYIQVSDTNVISKVKSYRETEPRTAQTFLQTGRFFWNSASSSGKCRPSSKRSGNTCPNTTPCSAA